MKKLWQKNNSLHPRIERFTAGSDWQYDNHLLYFDCVSSIAHARTLHAAAILTKEECGTLEDGIRHLIGECHAGEFRMTSDYEDCHTAIESYLVARCGSIGKKIHTGRSRNDQVFCALLLYGRQSLFEIIDAAFAFAHSCGARARQEERTEMMGRTHLQNAMPSTVGVWMAAYAEQMVILSDMYEALYRVGNRSPLGSAAGYGVPLPLDRPYTARLLGFDEPYQIVLAAANSRGHWEAFYTDVLTQITMIISRLAADILLFTLPELGYMRLPAALLTGSSIMPHKRNPDVLELMRAKAARIIGSSAQIKQIMHALPAGYNRDLQETKALLIESITTVREILEVARLVVDSLKIDRARLRDSIDPHIYSVDRALRLVEEKGITFRDAYHAITTASDADTSIDYAALLASRTSLGAPGNLQLPTLIARITSARKEWNARHTKVTALLHALSGE